MIKKLFTFLIGCFKSGEGRTQKLKRNVAWSTIIKICQMLIELAKVPILLSYLDNDKYGIWLTIISILVWTSHFDMGLGSGLRYKLTESIAKGNTLQGRKLISTAYFSMASIMMCAFLVFAPIMTSLDWNNILNAQSVGNAELITTIISVFFVFVCHFVLDLVSVVLKADQRAAISDVFRPIGSVLSLALILLLGFFSHNSLLLASLAMAVPSVLVLLIASVYFYSREYQNVRPAITLFDRHLLKDIYSLGLKYFLSQVAALIVFSTANILLSRLINPSEVTTYNIARTYYGLTAVFANMILVPFSAATTDAYVRDDFEWIKNSMKKLRMAALLLSVATIIMFSISKFAIHLWVGDKVIVPLGLSVAFAVYYILNVWVSPYANFLGAVGKLSIRVYIALFKIITFIPFSIWMIKIWGSVGLVVAVILINTLVNLIFGIIQYKLIINRKARGLWNK